MILKKGNRLIWRMNIRKKGERLFKYNFKLTCKKIPLQESLQG